MKRILFMLAAVLMLGACTDEQKVTVTVTNPTELARVSETVELSWDELTAKLDGLTADNVVVLDADKVQIPSQVVYEGEPEPRLLIFQVSIEGKKKTTFTVKTGERKNYPVQAYGRFVPERKDDYAWENNVVAFRAYGPALEAEMITPGLDYWSKSTSDLVIDAWYEKDLSGQGSYHVDTGEGCDVYKVGVTLGMGASAPVLDGHLVLPNHNFSTWKTLDNGPIRTSVQLIYAPFPVGDGTVGLTKVITLDANTHFNRITDYYNGTIAHMNIAAGMIMHSDVKSTIGQGYSAIYEAASDSRTGDDGMVAGAIVMPDGTGDTIDGTFVRVGHVHPGEPLTYYAGAGTSKADITSSELWFTLVKEKTAAVVDPLRIELQ